MNQESVNDPISVWSGYTTALSLSSANTEEEWLRSCFEEGLEAIHMAKRAWRALYVARHNGTSTAEQRELVGRLYAQMRKAQIVLEMVGGGIEPSGET